MVEELLKFKLGLDEIVNNCFQNSDLFLNVLKECFEAFINTRQNKPAELVAKYLDLRLRSGNKVMHLTAISIFSPWKQNVVLHIYFKVYLTGDFLALGPVG